MRKRWIARVVEDDLGDRRELDALHRLGGALGLGVEAAGAVEDVAEEVEADRRPGAGREEVDDAAADGELAGLGDGGALLEAHAGEVAGGGAPTSRRLPTSAVKEAAARVSRAGTRWVAALTVVRIAAGREKPAARAASVAMRRGGDLGVRRDAVVGQAVPGREGQDRDLRREEAQARAEAGDAGVVAGDVHDRARRPGDDLGQVARVEALGAAADEEASGTKGPEFGHRRAT